MSDDKSNVEKLVDEWERLRREDVLVYASRYIADLRAAIAADRKAGWHQYCEYGGRVMELRAEIERLQRWKSEALVVLADWEKVWRAAELPRPRLRRRRKPLTDQAYIEQLERELGIGGDR